MNEKLKISLFIGELQEIKHDISSLRYELLESDKKQMETIFKLLQNTTISHNNAEEPLESQNICANTSTKPTRQSISDITSQLKLQQSTTKNQPVRQSMSSDSIKSSRSPSLTSKPPRPSSGITGAMWGKPRSAVAQREIRRIRGSVQDHSPTDTHAPRRISGVYPASDENKRMVLENLKEESFNAEILSSSSDNESSEEIESRPLKS